MFVASFIGSPRINLVMPSTLRVGTDVTRGRTLVAGMRPEDIVVGRGPAPEGALSGRVYVAESLGAETLVTLEIDGHRLTGRASADFLPRSGEIAWAKPSLARAHFFDPKTTRRVEL